jgi:hypothetical protein
MRRHHDNLDAAIWKYGFGRGEMSLRQFRQAQSELSSLRAAELGYINPYARTIWEHHLRSAITACKLDVRPLLMATMLDRRWHFPWGRWAFYLEEIIGQAELALDGLSYLLLIEIAPFTHVGRKLVAPHLQGFIFGNLSRRQKELISSRFAGGLGDASPFRAQTVYDFVGASRYNVKPPDRMRICFASHDGKHRRRRREMSLTGHYFLWQHLRRYLYPQLTFAGGRGKRVLELAKRSAGIDV